MKTMQALCADGQTREIEVKWHQDGLCVHREVRVSLEAATGIRYGRRWAVAHQSGFYLKCGLRNKEEAVAAAHRFLPLADWRQSAEVLRACPSLRIDVHALQRELAAFA